MSLLLPFHLIHPGQTTPSKSSPVCTQSILLTSSHGSPFIFSVSIWSGLGNKNTWLRSLFPDAKRVFLLPKSNQIATKVNKKDQKDVLS